MVKNEKPTGLVVTLPCYDDSEFLAEAVETLERETRKHTADFKVLVVEDVFNSSRIIENLQKRYGNIIHFHSSEKQGRGKALRRAWRQVDGDMYLFMDVDLSTDVRRMDAYAKLIKGVSESRFSIVTGSRYLPESKAYRPILRWFASKAYNQLIRLLFQTRISDHQCGFKSFSRKCVIDMDPLVKSDSWFWDTEILVIAKRMGYKILEIPVFWVEMKGPRTPMVRLIKDIWLHGTGIIRLLLRVNIEL
jgi:glycosyltransferase involved in cell wall biosynthesis